MYAFLKNIACTLYVRGYNIKVYIYIMMVYEELKLTNFHSIGGALNQLPSCNL